ncbi:hypothetical protein [Nocardia sp. NPDC047654]|uniref:hypothetical protein n=1 Tax=Nocardia sp. NPDC047654 TaxID=3364314 RepID=UPI003720239F
MRAGVADSSIYRRWGTLEALTTDVAITWLTTNSPIPDTRSLDSDLRSYAVGVARDVTGPRGSRSYSWSSRCLEAVRPEPKRETGSSPNAAGN